MVILMAIFLAAMPWQSENVQAAADQSVQHRGHVSSSDDRAARAAKFKAYMKSVNESKSGQWFGKMVDSLMGKIKISQKQNKLTFKQQMEAQRAKREAARQAKQKAKEEEHARLQARKMAREKKESTESE